MSFKSELAWIETMIERSAARYPTAHFYLFGSMLSDKKLPGDIDIAVVYGQPEEAKQIREALAEVCLEFPIHLFMLTKEEDQALHFLSKQGCRPLFPRQV